MSYDSRPVPITSKRLPSTCRCLPLYPLLPLRGILRAWCAAPQPSTRGLKAKKCFFYVSSQKLEMTIFGTQNIFWGLEKPYMASHTLRRCFEAFQRQKISLLVFGQKKEVIIFGLWTASKGLLRVREATHTSQLSEDTLGVTLLPLHLKTCGGCPTKWNGNGGCNWGHGVICPPDHLPVGHWKGINKSELASVEKVGWIWIWKCTGPYSQIGVIWGLLVNRDMSAEYGYALFTCAYYTTMDWIEHILFSVLQKYLFSIYPFCVQLFLKPC